LKNYKCIKGFSLPVYDENESQTDEWSEVSMNTTWRTPEDDEYRAIGGEVRLESDDLGWIEISEQTLKEYFEEE